MPRTFSSAFFGLRSFFVGSWRGASEGPAEALAARVRERMIGGRDVEHRSGKVNTDFNRCTWMFSVKFGESFITMGRLSGGAVRSLKSSGFWFVYCLALISK